MKTPKHTPGPWRVGDNGATVFGPKTDKPSPQTIATLTKTPMILGETKANARLIAAAPEMYEALEKALEYLKAPEHVHPRFTIGMIETLLSKIGGAE